MISLPVGSHTIITDFDNCPYKAFHKHVAKDLPKETPSDALVWGRRVHTAFDDRLKKEIKLPKDMEQYENLLALIDSWQPEWIEAELGMRQDGTPTTFFAHDVWFRGKADVGIRRATTVRLFDYKTGKRREEDPSELEMHALLLKVTYPDIQDIRGHYLWLQEPENHRLGDEHNLSDFGRTYSIIKSSLNTISNYGMTGEWPKKPNPLCDYCPVKTCEFNGKWKQNRKGFR